MLQKPKIKVVLKKRDGGLTNSTSELNKRLTTIKNSKIGIVKKINKALLKRSMEYESRLLDFKDNKRRTKISEKKDIEKLISEYKEKITPGKTMHLTPEGKKIYLQVVKTHFNFQILYRKTIKYILNSTAIDNPKKIKLHEYTDSVFSYLNIMSELGLKHQTTTKNVIESTHNFLLESLKQINKIDSKDNLKNLDAIINIWKDLNIKIENKIQTNKHIDNIINNN